MYKIRRQKKEIVASGPGPRGLAAGADQEITDQASTQEPMRNCLCPLPLGWQGHALSVAKASMEKQTRSVAAGAK